MVHVWLQVTHSIHTVRVELYESAGDYVRLVLEILLTIWVCIQLLSMLWSIVVARRRQVTHPAHLLALDQPRSRDVNSAAF